MPLAAEHKETESLIRASGLQAVILRNGWYTENYTAGIPTALQYGVVLGSAKQGRIASAARADFAEAAAAVLTQENQAGRIYELAGDESYTLAELAAEIARQSGKAVAYQDLPESEFKATLLGAGLPDFLATLLAESDVGASKGGIEIDCHTGVNNYHPRPESASSSRSAQKSCASASIVRGHMPRQSRCADNQGS